MPKNKTTTDTIQEATAPLNFSALVEEDERKFQQFPISKYDYFLIFLIGLLFLIVFLQFFTRYILNDSLSWTEEAARYLLIITTFAGAVRCQLKDSHISLEFMDKYFGSFLPWIRRIGAVMTLGVLALLIYSAFELASRTSFQKMVSLPFPKYYLHSLIIFLLSINFLILVWQLVKQLKHNT